jgi:hypothetical protein
LIVLYHVSVQHSGAALCLGNTETGDDTMKRIVVLAVLAVLLLVTVGATPAVAASQKTVVTKKVYQSNGAGTMWGVVGTVTYDTMDGSWTFTQRDKVTLPLSGGDLYYLGITSSRPVGRTFGESYQIDILPEPIDGTISDSGMGDRLVINSCLENGGVFIIYTGNF